MEKGYENTTSQELYTFSKKIKKLIRKNQLDMSKQLIIEQMVEHPDCAEPHNLLGIIAEIRNNHVLAMKHFRAAWALDPTYEPARLNMDIFGEFGAEWKNAVYTVDDIEKEDAKAKKIGHELKKNVMKKVAMFTL